MTLREMKPQKMTPAHHSPSFGELVCSNSLRSGPAGGTRWGLLKEEPPLRLPHHGLRGRPPGGGGRRWQWTAMPSGSHYGEDPEPPQDHCGGGEVTDLPAEGQVIVASGPLTSDPLAEAIARRYPQNGYLHFFDAAAPLVTFDSVDMESAWFASRYDRGRRTTSTAP